MSGIHAVHEFPVGLLKDDGISWLATVHIDGNRGVVRQR
jgi:hypothetical protein